MARIINEIVKIPFKQNLTFGQRKKTLNEQIQKAVDSYNSRGWITIAHTVKVETATHASVQFTVQQMIKG
jgi:hypothetical protein